MIQREAEFGCRRIRLIEPCYLAKSASSSGNHAEILNRYGLHGGNSGRWLIPHEVFQHFTEECDEAERLKVELAAKLERLRAGYRVALINYEADKLGRRVAA